jgi:DNA-3-methyladenine glycosylase
MILRNSFFKKPTLEVAKSLLGKTLVRKYPFDPAQGKRGKFIKGIITETEAYIGFDDKASHASRGKTERTKVMFDKAGTIYVYLIYGMYHCLNIVTEEKEYPAAVLIRGVKEINGPGRLCRYFHIDKKLNHKKLGRESGLWIENRKKIPLFSVETSKRIGVEYAGSWSQKPWRFCAKFKYLPPHQIVKLG